MLSRRLFNHRLIASELHRPRDVVEWLVAIQAQEYAAAKWAIGLRARGLTEADVERAFNDGSILRTHVMRPTWHFVTPADIRWLLALTAPRISALMRRYHRQLELDGRVVARSHAVFERALAGGQYLTRPELAAALARKRIPAQGLRLAFLVMQAELDQVICGGPRRGKQFTYALLDERVPRAKARTREEALAELARRYFSSHGPATVKDYVWWSGLTVLDAIAGIELAGPALRQEVIGERTYWSATTAGTAPRASRSAFLLPIYDEYLIAYKHRELATPSTLRTTPRNERPPFNNSLVIDGRLAGSWRRVVNGNRVAVTAHGYRPLSATELRRVRAAAERFGTFLSLGVQFSTA